MLNEKTNMKKLAGGKLAGGNPKNGRVQNDYYATNPVAVEMLLHKYVFNAGNILEPCVGAGHIAKTLKEHFRDSAEITCIDIVDRGYPGTIVQDFLSWETDKLFDGIITNPPFSQAQDFIEKGFSLLSDGGRMAFFLKIQFLEGAKRKKFFENYPPKYIYVFRNRMAVWNNGNEVNPDTGKKWATTMCFAWFCWEKGNADDPVIKWL